MIRKSGDRFSEKIMLHQNARAQNASIRSDLRSSDYRQMALPRSVPGPGAAAAACRAHRHRTGESRKTLRAAAYRSFQILVRIFWDEHIFIGLIEMVHRVAHGSHPVPSPNLQIPERTPESWEGQNGYRKSWRATALNAARQSIFTGCSQHQCKRGSRRAKSGT